MTTKLLYRLLIGHGLVIEKVYESQSPEYFHDVVFIEPVAFTIGFKSQEINSDQFPDEIIDYRRFSLTEFRLYFKRIDSIFE